MKFCDVSLPNSFVQKPYERTDKRKGQRNGYYNQRLVTRIGTLSDLRIPPPPVAGV